MINLKEYIKDIKKFLILEEFLKNTVEEQQDLLQSLYSLKDKFDAFMEKVNEIASKNESDPQEVFDEIIARAKEQGTQEEKPQEESEPEPAPAEDDEPEDSSQENGQSQEVQQN